MVSNGNPKYDSRNNCNAIIETLSNTLIVGCKNTIIPNSVTSIDRYAFCGCSGLASVTIPNSVITIGDCAFYNCSNLASVTIPSSVTSIGYGILMDWSALTSIMVSNGNPKYDSRNNSNAIIETSSNTLIAGCKNTIIPNGVTSIGEYAFSGCSSLSNVTIPNSVTSIGEYAFSGCISLSNVTIPNSVTSICDGAFAFCHGLASMTIPNSVISIGDGAFAYCSGLTSLNIPNSVTSIGDEAFYYCSSLTFVKSEIKNPFNIKDNVFYKISSIAILQVPKGTRSKYEAFYGWKVYFKEIREANEEQSSSTYTLSITAKGSGYVSYNGTSIRSETSSFTVNEGTNATISFTPDNGFRIKSLKVNNTDVTSNVLNSSYTIRSVNKDINVEVAFEEIPVSNYSLSIRSSGSGSVSYNGSTIRNRTTSFTVEEGTNATITFTPDNGYRLKSVLVNNYNVTSSVSNNSYTISNISRDTNVEVEFEAIPATTYTLSVKAVGSGSASYNGTIVRDKTSTFSVSEGTNATITFTPDNGYRIKSLVVNSADVTSYISNNAYTINNITKNTTLVVEFEAEPTAFAVNGVNYAIRSNSEKTVAVSRGTYGAVLEIPAKVSYQNAEWKVTSIESNALSSSPDLCAIIWNPEVAFTENVRNPNLLLYVKSEDYAPTAIKNVVVNGSASSITLTDAASGNNFYCPEEFTAKSVSYTHHYTMDTGLGESKGWETIALPFDVQKISHQSKGEIVMFANWNSGDSKKPFWLMQYGNNGWTDANSIKAYTPYIISMPNHTRYKEEYKLNGNVIFSAENVKIGKTENLSTSYSNGKTFIPNFALQTDKSYYALNVNNDYIIYNGNIPKGSLFYPGLRDIHPFEAYMTTASGTRSIAIADDMMTTGIRDIMEMIDEQKDVRVYNLKGQLIKTEDGKSLDQVKKTLPAGVYIVNGQKVIIK